MYYLKDHGKAADADDQDGYVDMAEIAMQAELERDADEQIEADD